jgi:hypothetical protein
MTNREERPAGLRLNNQVTKVLAPGHREERTRKGIERRDGVLTPCSRVRGLPDGTGEAGNF